MVTKSVCMRVLKSKIKKNMGEYKSGRYVSPKQAVAVSYSQVRKSKPGCSRYFKNPVTVKKSRKVVKKSVKKSRKVVKKSVRKSRR